MNDPRWLFSIGFYCYFFFNMMFYCPVIKYWRYPCVDHDVHRDFQDPSEDLLREVDRHLADLQLAESIQI